MPLPPVLADPPWRKRAPEAAALPAAKHEARAVPAITTELVWEDGEREAFAGKCAAPLAPAGEERLFERLMDELDGGAPIHANEAARLGDEKLAELAGELTGSTADAAIVRLALGRLEGAFVEHAIALVKAAPRERALFEAAAPLRSPELARTAAGAVFDRAVPASEGERCPRTAAEAWLLRHPTAAAAGLAGDDSKQARGALAWLAAHGAKDAMRPWLDADTIAALAPYAALAPIAQARPWAVLLAAREDPRAASMLEAEPCAAVWVARARGAKEARKLAAVPERVAELPAFFDAAAIARPRLAEGSALEDAALVALAEMLRFSPLANPYPGVAQVRAACDPASLDAFALDLFERWRAAGEDPREAWAFESCGKVGGPRAARAVAERVRGWARGTDAPRWGVAESREFLYARAGCAVLAAIHDDTARVLLADLARGAVQAWLRKEAKAALGEGAAGEDEVEAPVPDVGLDPDGSATFDTGSRTLRVRIDDTLTPVLEDAEGARVASFPRLRKGDDPKLHAEAKQRFADIVKDSKIVTRYQIGLLERMMCDGRAFERADFARRWLEHAFLRHAGRRVVWVAGGATFRVVEDGTFADAGDAPFTLGEVDVGVAHPAAMRKDEREAWRAILADYQIVQPFRQLERETYACGAAEIGEHAIARVVSATTTRGKLFALARRDWRPHFDRADVTEYTRELPCGAVGRFEVTPPLGHGPDDQPYTVAGASCTWSLDRLPPVDYSELVRDLEQLRG